MVDAAPFEAVRYAPGAVGDPAVTSAPAYEDVGRFAYASHRTASPYTILELLTPGPDGDYAAAGATYERWRRTDVLVREPRAAFYVYEEHELRDGVPAVQRGILAAVGLEPLDGTGAVLPHESVVPERVDRRLDRLDAVPLDVSPVFAVYRGADAELRELLDAPPRRPPLIALTDEAGTDHRIWVLDDAAGIDVVRRGLLHVRAVIADGHHRYASALAHARRLRERASAAGAIPAGGAPSPWERTLMYLVDADAPGPRPLPIHRVVDDLPHDVLERLAVAFTAESAVGNPRDLERAVARAGTPGLLLHDGSAVLLRVKDPRRIARALPPDRSPTWRSLPSVVLDHAVLPLAGGTATAPWSDVNRAAEVVRGRPRAGLFVLPPVSTRTVMRLAEEGEPMPPKSTSFRPKPRTGLLMRELDPPDDR